ERAQPFYPKEMIQQPGYHFTIRSDVAPDPPRVQELHVRAVRTYVAIVDDRRVHRREWVRPDGKIAGRIGGLSRVRYPHVCSRARFSVETPHSCDLDRVTDFLVDTEKPAIGEYAPLEVRAEERPVYRVDDSLEKRVRVRISCLETRLPDC